jgi:hypothetical protein
VARGRSRCRCPTAIRVRPGPASEVSLPCLAPGLARKGTMCRLHVHPIGLRRMAVSATLPSPYRSPPYVSASKQTLRRSIGAHLLPYRRAQPQRTRRDSDLITHRREVPRLMRRLQKRLSVLGLATVCAVAATSSPAQAYSGYGWDGKSPIGTTCATDAHNPRSAPAKTIYTPSGKPVGKIELRYSVKCSTAWARITNYYTAVPGDTHGGYGRSGEITTVK